MKIKNLKNSDIIKNKTLNSKFLSANLEKLKINCKIYKGDFYVDSFNFFPITTENFSFLELFAWNKKSKFKHFYTKDFFTNFSNNRNNSKKFENVIVLGSSPANNYYRNLITFFPRIFFIADKKINLAIHRKSSNKFRKFIKKIFQIRGIEVAKTVYLDDGLYNFQNSQIPQFLSEEVAIKLLNKVFSKKNNLKNKIYLTRKNASYRKLINEADLIDYLKSKQFLIIDLETFDIEKQIDLFSSAEVVISPTSSSLANIIFCNTGTKIIEITPRYKFRYENELKSRYSNICKWLNLKYFSLPADPVEIEKVDEYTKEVINLNIIKESNYYKDFLVKENDLKKIINKI